MTSSALLLASATAQHSPAVLITRLTVTHPSLAAPWRACNDTQDLVTGDGTIFYAHAFSFAEPSSEPGTDPSIRLEVDNIDRQLQTILRGLPLPRPQLKAEMVFRDSPDQVERLYQRLYIAGFSADTYRLSLTLTFRSLRAEPFPFQRFDGRFPTLFQ